MKTLFINEINTGQKLEAEYFLISEFKNARTKNGDAYYRFELSDKTGRIPGVMWPDNVANAEKGALKVGEVVSLDATVDNFNEKPQLIIQRIAKANEFHEEDFKEVSKRELGQMWKDVEEVVGGVKNEHLQKLLENILSDGEIVEKFKKYPAAKTVHHQYVGGFVEHVLEMIDIAETLLKHYPEADDDLVMTGVLLHDIGKLVEYTQVGVGYDFSTEGKLLGHLILGSEMVISHLPKDFPRELQLKLLHIILSHHGRLEFGSPVVPKTIEAAIVRAADEASSKVRQYQKHLKNFEGSDQEFTDFDPFLEAEVYLK